MYRVYLDHAATTPVAPEVAEAMAGVLRDMHGNPSSIYAEGRAARALVDRARDEVAAAIGAQPAEIVWHIAELLQQPGVIEFTHHGIAGTAEGHRADIAR